MPVPLPNSPHTPFDPSPFLERLIRFLFPFFVDVCPDPAAVRAEVLETLASYGPRTRAELLNAAQVIAYGLAGLETLQEAQGTEMSPSARLRFRGSANNLNRSSLQSQQALTKRLAFDPPFEPVGPMTEADLATQERLEKMINAVQAMRPGLGIQVPDPHHPSRSAYSVPPTRPDLRGSSHAP
jgi:hypothetical protein